jgi:glycerol uptake facilitator protein
MDNFVSELVGTMVLLLLGNGVVAGVVLKGTKSNNSGWIVITMGWGLAVAMAVFVSQSLGGDAHLNPAVSLAAFLRSDLELVNLLAYVVAQMIGAILGSILVLVMYYPHFEKTQDAGSVLAPFSTGPAIRHTVFNLVSEAIGTFVLVFVIFSFPTTIDGLGPVLVGLLVVGIGLSLGGTTGYAINPARDLGPRLVHYFLPVPNKGSSDWNYAWIPVVGPLLGGALAAVVTTLLVG